MSNTYSLVLLGRYPGKDKPVAQALGRAFGKDEQWGLPIVGATPINLLTGLNAGQAQAIHAALAEVEQAGSKIQVSPAADESCPTVSWPSEPSIAGRSVSAFSAGAAPAAAGAAAGAGAALACPHCGKPVQVRLFPPVQAAAAPTPVAPAPVPVPAPAAAASGAAPRRTPAPGTAVRPKEPPTPRRPSPPVPIPIPVPQAQAPRPAAAAQPAKPPAPAPVPSPAADGLEELVPIQDFTPSSTTTPPQPMRLPQAPGKVLPEVPVVDSAPPQPAAPQLGGPAPSPSQSGPGLGLPVDLEAFEAGLQMGPAPEAPEQQVAEHVVPPVKPPARKRGAAPPVNPDALCSIFIGKSRDSRVHELVAEIQGTSVEEAEDLCRKAVVPVVKDIPVGEAEEIKKRFQELKVNPRIAVKR